MSLSDIQSGRQTKPRRVLLFGPHGLGKSTFGAMSPDPIFVPTEDGLADIDCHAFPLVQSYAEFQQRLQELAAEEHDYKSVVIDSLDWLERLIWTQVCADRGVENIEDIGYAKGYTFALTYWREVLIALDWLRNERGMMVILLAHAKIERFENPETEAYDRYSPKLHKLASAVVQEWCDEVLFANYRPYAKTSGEGFDKRAIGVGQGERIIRTTERPAHVAKNRCNLPDELPLDFRAYAAAIAL